jgi:anti-sigma B factor antagonist
MEESCFKLAAERDGTTLCLTLTGDFDRAGIGQVERALEEARALPLDHVILDLSGLTFLDLAGLRTILSVDRRAQAEAFGVTVVRPRGLANRVFTLTRAGETLSMTDR